MSLAPGTRLGSYEVLDLLGKGGMGEVYRALDQKLGREVALKLLPESFSEDPERLARFEREARILASLNHPNVATLHGLEESGGWHFLIMELVPGETLAERLKRGRLSLEEALPLFRQIAHALEAAHEKGVIHRDLKPANIKITEDGKVSVLDFGLAKVFDETPLSSDLSHSPTVTREGTRVGTVMGTAAYMSPEQTRGKRLDRRSDLWSFGCCLFEALTGSKAFDGETVTDVFAAIVRGEPDWSRLSGDVPESLQLLLRRCLTKDPAHRLRDAGDAALELDEVEARPVAAPRERRSIPRVLSVAGLAIALLGLGIGIGSRLGHEPGGPSPVKRLDLYLGEDLTVGELGWSITSLSPDGRRLVFVGRSEGGRDQLYLRELATGATTSMDGTEGAYEPFFSPDSEWIGFAAGGWLKKVAVRGGAPVPICRAVVDFGATWGDEGTIVYRENAPGLFRVSASGGEPRRFTNEDHMWPAFLPGGKSILVWHRGGIAVVSLETGESKRVVELGNTPRYLSGYLLYWYEQSLYAAPFDLEKLATSPAGPVVESVRKTFGGPALYAVSEEGSLVYLAGGKSLTAERSLVWVGRDGSFETVSETRRAFGVPRLSPDGTRVALGIAEGNSVGDVWIYDIPRDSLRRLTLGGTSGLPLWSPDGREVAFSSWQNDTWRLMRAPGDGSGTPDVLLTTERFVIADSWSRDGRSLLYTTPAESTAWDEWVLSLEDGSSRTVASSTAYDSEGAFSPDGKWVVYHSAESGTGELYVVPASGGGARHQVSDRGGRDPVWTDRGEIVYRNGRRILSVSVQTEPDFHAGTPRVLFEGPFELETGGYRNFDVTRDGQRFVMILSEGEPLDRLVFVVNFVEELKRLVPSK